MDVRDTAPLLSPAAAERWRDRLLAARTFMRTRRHLPGVLIEVAAQHPLVDGATPGEEFAARLRRGHELFQEYRKAGRPVEVYVPGSRHRHLGVEDKSSLSRAGGDFLEKLGVAPSAVHGDDLNERYKGEAGVYGSADECFVAASYFKDGDFGTLVSVCSPAQMMRKTLHYLQFGVYPLNHTAPTPEGYHDFLDELLVSVPGVLDTDDTLQAPDSDGADRLRADRRPSAG
ncbi:hypothetical protein [Kitasatospora purpeofusca]|uniref:Uncharacterized protein n=1 Tax=Kitasatospora purpeofusca TaxID=67352 RepID=A0ABZ1UBC1_9ACTN|nr:hypothetical protein [Kitasatospora purpeofusca]